MKRTEYRYVTVYSYDAHPDIVFGTYAPKLDIDLAIAKELIDNRMTFSGGKPVYAVIDFTNVKSVTKEARDYMNSPDGGLKGLLGGAFLSNNVVATLFVNLFLKVAKPAIPARFFNNEAEAIKWLRRVQSDQLKAC